MLRSAEGDGLKSLRDACIVRVFLWARVKLCSMGPCFAYVYDGYVVRRIPNYGSILRAHGMNCRYMVAVGAAYLEVYLMPFIGLERLAGTGDEGWQYCRDLNDD